MLSCFFSRQELLQQEEAEDDLLKDRWLQKQYRMGERGWLSRAGGSSPTSAVEKPPLPKRVQPDRAVKRKNIQYK